MFVSNASWRSGEPGLLLPQFGSLLSRFALSWSLCWCDGINNSEKQFNRVTALMKNVCKNWSHLFAVHLHSASSGFAKNAVCFLMRLSSVCSSLGDHMQHLSAMSYPLQRPGSCFFCFSVSGSVYPHPLPEVAFPSLACPRAADHVWPTVLAFP